MSGRRGAWFHCFAGIAGDMALGSLLDAGADFDEVLALLNRLPVGGWELETEAVLRSGLAATQAHVHATPGPVVRTHSHIIGLIEEARLPDRVRDRALSTFAAIAEVEGALHRRHPSRVHFHEVGGLDAIVDIVGTAAALEVLAIDEVFASAVATGTGVVRSAHGVIPNPPPAVVELLRGVPTYGLELSVELTTPTGAALLAALATGFGPLPPMHIEATGFGAGSHEFDGMPNVTQVVVGTLDTAAAATPAQPVLLLEANVDDATGEAIAHAIGVLLEAGAHDAWVTPIVMKKGRPAYTVSVLCDAVLGEELGGLLSAETGTLGIRRQMLERWAAPRSFDEVEVEVDGLPVRIKVSPGRVKPEHDDVARVARRTGLPLREVVRLAEDAWYRRPSPSIHPGHFPSADDPDDAS